MLVPDGVRVEASVAVPFEPELTFPVLNTYLCNSVNYRTPTIEPRVSINGNVSHLQEVTEHLHIFWCGPSNQDVIMSNVKERVHGISVRDGSESVFGMNRNGCSACVGIRRMTEERLLLVLSCRFHFVSFYSPISTHAEAAIYSEMMLLSIYFQRYGLFQRLLKHHFIMKFDRVRRSGSINSGLIESVPSLVKSGGLYIISGCCRGLVPFPTWIVPQALPTISIRHLLHV